MHVVAVNDHLNQLQRRHQRENHARNRENHIVAQVSDHAEYAAVPRLRRCTHVVRNARHLSIHIVKQPGEVAHNAADEQFLEPLRNLIPKKIQNNHLLSRQIA